MKRQRAIETSEGLVRAFGDLFDGVGPETAEETDAILQEAGLDPDELGARMKAAAEQALADSPLNWRQRAPRELEDERTQIANDTTDVPRSREGVINSINQLLKQLGDQVAFAHRNLEAETDEDLVSLLVELRYFASQQRRQG